MTKNHVQYSPVIPNTVHFRPVTKSSHAKSGKINTSWAPVYASKCQSSRYMYTVQQSVIIQSAGKLTCQLAIKYVNNHQSITLWNRLEQSHACYFTATWILYCTILHHTVVVSCCFKVILCDVNATPLYGTPILVKDKLCIKSYLKETATVKKSNWKLRK
jgi:hypothetical protein